jgi:hypothetical protein
MMPDSQPPNGLIVYAARELNLRMDEITRIFHIRNPREYLNDPDKSYYDMKPFYRAQLLDYVRGQVELHYKYRLENLARRFNQIV